MAEVVQEFLVGLGFKSDGLAKFEDTLKGVGEQVAALSAGMSVAAASVSFAITKMAGDFDKLYFQAKNLGASAGEIKQLGYAFTQLGGSASDANSIMNSIANFRMAYGQNAAGFLERLGVSPKDVDNSARTLIDLEKIFQRMAGQGPNGLSRANAYASFLGISPDQLRIMLRDTGEFEQQLQAWAQKNGIDFDKAAESSHAFMTQLRELRMQFDLMVESKGVELIKDLQPILAGLTKQLNSLPPGEVKAIADAVVIFAAGLAGLAASALIAAPPLAILAAAIGAVALNWGKLKSEWSGFENWWEGILKKTDSPTMNSLRGFFGIHPHDHAGGGGTPVPALPHPSGSTAAGSPSGGGGSNNFGNLRFAGSPAFRQFASASEGLRAMASQILRDQNVHGARNIYELIAGRMGADGRRHWGWAPREDGNNPEVYAAFVAKRLGVNPTAALNFSDPTILAGMMSAMSALEKGHHVFSPDQIKAVLGPQGDRNMQFNQTNNYTVHGTDPHSTADLIGQKQQHNNAKFVTNTSVWQW